MVGDDPLDFHRSNRDHVFLSLCHTLIVTISFARYAISGPRTDAMTMISALSAEHP